MNSHTVHGPTLRPCPGHAPDMPRPDSPYSLNPRATYGVRLKRCWCQGAKDFLRHIIIEYVWEFNNQVTFTKNIVRWLRCIETYWDARFLSHCEFLHAVSQLQIKSCEPAQLQKGAPGGSGGRNPLPPPVLKTIKPSCTQNHRMYCRLSSGIKSKHINNWLVVYLPLWKNMKVSWDDEIPNIWKFIKFMFQTTNQK